MYSRLILTLCLLVVPDVMLPHHSSPTEPAPTQTPTVVDTLAADEWYVIPSPEPLKVLASPDGIVEIEEDSGPLRLRGKFAGGSGIEARTIESPHVYLITAKTAGQVELLILESNGSLTRQRLTVGGAGPRPPPVPVLVDPVQPPSGLQVILLIDQGDPVSSLAAVNSAPVLQWLGANTTQVDGRPGWRRWDRSSLSDPDTLATESAVWSKLWQDIGGNIPAGPQLVAVTGNKVTTRPITTQDQLMKDLAAAKDGRL
jgi:hypothetical protein